MYAKLGLSVLKLLTKTIHSVKKKIVLNSTNVLSVGVTGYSHVLFQESWV